MTGNPVTYTARDGMRDPETLRRWHMIRYEQRAPGVTPAQRMAMRAERLGTTPDELAARRARRLAELAAELSGGGLIPATGGPGDPAAVDTVIRVSLPEDSRPAWLVCAMCCRTLHKRKGRRVEVRPAVFCCRCCASLPQNAPHEVLDSWLAGDANYKRHAIAATYQTDPATLTATETSAETARMYAAADGTPLAVETTRTPTVACLVPVNSFFALVRQRGRGIL